MIVSLLILVTIERWILLKLKVLIIITIILIAISIPVSGILLLGLFLQPQEVIERLFGHFD